MEGDPEGDTGRSRPLASAGVTDRSPERTEERSGVLYGFAAYGLWGAFPLVFHQLRDVAAIEVLLHRITWSFVAVVAVLLVRRDRAWAALLRRGGPDRGRLVAAAAVISVNWLVYVWAVGQGRVVEAALGYYINPLVTVVLGVVLLGETLERTQLVALLMGAAAVVVLTVAHGSLPWVSLVLACSFGLYGYLKKSVAVGALTSLAVETAVLVPLATVGLVVLTARGELSFLHGPLGRDLLLLALGTVTAVPLLLFAASARRVKLVVLGLLQYLTPTLQLIVGVWILGEELPPERLVGFVLVWIALVILGLDAVRSSRRAGRVPGHDAVIEVSADPTKKVRGRLAGPQEFVEVASRDTPRR